MFDSEQDALKRGEHHIILQEYNDIVDDLKRELEICKTEQNGIRSELQTLQIESKSSSDAMRDYISRVHLEECGGVNKQDKVVTNLKEHIAVLQTEKDSVTQLWQVSMKAVDTLEQELRARPMDDRNAKFYEDQLNDVRQSYSEAIKALESKLHQAKEHFAKQQSLWMTSKETMESLRKEKREAAEKLEELQRNLQQKDRNSQQTIHSLTEKLYTAKAEIQGINHLKSDLEKRLSESRKVASNIAAKNEETKCKMAEALDLIESAVRERDTVLQREAQIAEEKTRLEARLASIVEEHAARMQSEMARLKDAHEHSAKKYLLEMKELKSELREKVTLLDRSQRESRLAEEELDRVRRDSEDLLEKSAARIVDLEQALKQADSKLEASDEAYRKRHDSEMQQLRQKIVHLEEQLAASDERLKQIQQQSSTDLVRDRIRLADERAKDAIERYVNVEDQLTRATSDKESLVTELKSLQSAFDREIRKRDCERHALESKIRDLGSNLQRGAIMENKSSIDVNAVQIPPQHCADAIKKHTLDIRFENADHNWQLLLAEQLSRQQEQFDKKIKEMTQHVTIHQDLSKKFRDEAISLTTRFKVKSKELHRKINSLKIEKDELQKALLTSRQQFAQHKADTVYSYVQRPETS